MSDAVNSPDHYKAGGLEAIDVIEAWNLGFHLGNVIKYVLRADAKGVPLEDLRKGRWYLDREISRRIEFGGSNESDSKTDCCSGFCDEL